MRQMRIILMYDIYDDNSRESNSFRNNLIKNGYYMIQYSIYVKVIPSYSQYSSEKQKISKFLPKSANVRLILLSEKQYQEIELIKGNYSKNEIINNCGRYIKL